MAHLVKYQESSSSYERLLESKRQTAISKLAALERKYDELYERGDATHEDLIGLLNQLKKIMQIEDVQDVFEYQLGLSRIKAKVLKLQRQREESKKLAASKSRGTQPTASNNLKLYVQAPPVLTKGNFQDCKKSREDLNLNYQNFASRKNYY